MNNPFPHQLSSLLLSIWNRGQDEGITTIHTANYPFSITFCTIHCHTLAPLYRSRAENQPWSKEQDACWYSTLSLPQEVRKFCIKIQTASARWPGDELKSVLQGWEQSACTEMLFPMQKVESGGIQVKALKGMLLLSHISDFVRFIALNVFMLG